MAYYLESLPFIIISRFIYQPQSCENHKAQLSELSSSCRFISIFQKGTTLLKMLQRLYFSRFRRDCHQYIVTNICGYSQHCLFVFSKRRYYRKSETYSLQQRKNKQTKQKQQHAKTKPKKNYISTREDKGDREGILHTHPIPQVIHLELFLRPQIPRGVRQQPITQRECVPRGLPTLRATRPS